MNFEISSIVTAFSDKTIGTKVIHPTSFWEAVFLVLARHDESNDVEPGQHFIMLTDTNPASYLSGGIGKRTTNPNDYVLRLYRGQVKAYLRGWLAEPIEDAAVVIYTKEAYAKDPQVDQEELKGLDPECTHVLVAVLGFAGPSAPLTPGRFVQNLAGGNNEALRYTADQIREKAKIIADYWSSEDGGQGWCTVAD